MKKERTGKYRCIFALLLCMCMLFTAQPEIWNSFSVFAAEKSDTKVILSFAELEEGIKEQTVPMGTDYEELGLPEELTVLTITMAVETAIMPAIIQAMMLTVKGTAMCRVTAVISVQRQLHRLPRRQHLPQVRPSRQPRLSHWHRRIR